MSVPVGVVVHLAEGAPDRHRAVLQNVRNLMRALTGVPVELVTHGPGVDLALGVSAERNALTELMAEGLTVQACRNTLDARGLDAAELTVGVDVVDSGVAHLARRQFDGWAYLRP